MSGRGVTPVAVWAPSFAPLLDRVTPENSQATFANGPWCRLCEAALYGSDRAQHARSHDRELVVWRRNRQKLLRHESAKRLREVNRELRRTKKALTPS